MLIIKCPNCKSKFNNHISYANHILEQHKDDAIAVEWANITLGPTSKKPSEETVYLGKPLNRIPPKRQVKLPKYLQDQIPPEEEY